MEIADRVEHLPGQHYVVRLVAEDGYVAQRSYSVSSAPSDPLVELFVERLDDGEVSTYLADVVEPGDQLQVQGPIGRYFIWDADRPAFGLGGGSGVVPLVAMLRHAADKGRSDLLRLAVSSRTLADLPYADELMAAGALVALSRENAPTGRLQGRLTAAELEPYVRATDTCFICGSNAFAEAASELLLERGVPASAIRVERFGPSG
jgi:ferredoxin-NADP reductase